MIGTMLRLKTQYQGPNDWVLGIQSTATSQSFGMNIQNGTTFSVAIDWGDGSAIEVFSTTGIKTHVYATIGAYSIRMTCTGGCNMAIASTRPGLVVSTSAIPRTFSAGGGTPFNSTFLQCSSLANVPEDVFWYAGSTITSNSFNQTFKGCSSLNNISEKLFQKATSLTETAFTSTFHQCTGLTSIPADLFRYNTGMTTQPFESTFQQCTGLTSIPADLFRYNTGVTSIAFYSTFRDCTGLTSIPADIFRYNTGMTTTAFSATFMGCTGLNGYAVQADLLRYNILMSGTSTASNMFSGVTLNTVAYSNLLISLNTYLTASSLGFGGGSSKYDSSATTARAALVARSWSIVDGGAA